MAEAFAIKAMCGEKLPLQSTSKSRKSEREDNIIRCYELAGDLTLLFLQQADRTTSSSGYLTIFKFTCGSPSTFNFFQTLGGQSTWSVTSVGTTATTGSSSPIPSADYRPKMGPILESALYQAAVLYIKAGKNSKAIARYR